MENVQIDRVDEVSGDYRAPRLVAEIQRWLFWVAALLSVAILYTSSLQPWVQQAATVSFLVIVLTQFTLANAQKYHWLPRAECERRRALLTDALGSPLSHKSTKLYYNNELPPSIDRLGANIMENSHFGAAVSGRMLNRIRLRTSVYVLVWVVAFATRHDELALLIAVTQVIFSAEIISGWLSMEVLHHRFEQCYAQLHAYFLSQLSENSAGSNAVVLEIAMSYESAKSASGILLSEDVFGEINSQETESWHKVRRELGMGQAIDHPTV